MKRHIVSVALSDAEYEAMRKEAAASSMSLSSYIRFRATAHRTLVIGYTSSHPPTALWFKTRIEQWRTAHGGDV